MVKPITYRYQDLQIEQTPKFLYEVSIERVEPNRVNTIVCRYYTSGKLLNVKECKVIKRFKNFSLFRFITLLGAPKSFIKENNLPEFELLKKKR
jgi:hypothetical protein